MFICNCMYNIYSQPICTGFYNTNGTFFWWYLWCAYNSRRMWILPSLVLFQASALWGTKKCVKFFPQLENIHWESYTRANCGLGYKRGLYNWRQWMKRGCRGDEGDVLYTMDHHGCTSFEIARTNINMISIPCEIFVSVDPKRIRFISFNQYSVWL